MPWIILGATHASDRVDVDYGSQVKPILQAKCYSCHGALRKKGGLRVDTAVFLLRGGQGGPVVVPGDGAGSPLVERVSDTGDARMPPESEGDGLNAGQIAVLKTWIDQG